MATLGLTTVGVWLLAAMGLLQQNGAVFGPLSEQDLEDVRRLKPPPRLQGKPGRQSLQLHGDARGMFEQAAKAFGLQCVFDADYQPGPTVRLRLEDVGFDEALQQLSAATGSFVVPVGEKLFLVAKDTPQKRGEVEPTVAVCVPIPDPVTIQEAQELARTVQQAMEILRLVVDADLRLVYMRDRVSKVLPARALFEYLSGRRAQVAIEMELLEVDGASMLSYGLSTPTEFPIAYLGGAFHSRPSVATDFARMLVFGGGRTLLGFGLADARAFANRSLTTARTLMRTEVRALDGSPASFHVGDKYPILSGAYLAGGAGYMMPPNFNFEDLGLVLKVTPRVHGTEEVSLELEAEFKVLSGASFNGIPVISNRKLQSKVRLREGQWGVVAGLINLSDTCSVSGWPGLSRLPLLGQALRQHTRSRDSSEILVLLKPHLLDPPPAGPAPPLHLGTESRLRIPL